MFVHRPSIFAVFVPFIFSFLCALKKVFYCAALLLVLVHSIHPSYVAKLITKLLCLFNAYAMRVHSISIEMAMWCHLNGIFACEKVGANGATDTYRIYN